jgi:hypothetical protein
MTKNILPLHQAIPNSFSSVHDLCQVRRRA